MDFSHSNIINIFDQSGELAYQNEGLGVDHKKTVDKILDLVVKYSFKREHLMKRTVLNPKFN